MMVVREAYIRRAPERSEDEVKARLVLEVPWRCAALGAALEKMQCVGCGGKEATWTLLQAPAA